MTDKVGSSGTEKSIEWHYAVLQRVYETAVYNEQEISKRNAALSDATGQLSKQAAALPSFVSAEIAKKLEASFAGADVKLAGAVERVAERLRVEVDAAGAHIVARFEAANEKAKEAEAAYESAIKFSFLRVTSVALLSVLLGCSSMYAVARLVLPSEKKLEAMRIEETRLESNLASLKQRGAEIQVDDCKLPRGGVRPCVRTDESDSATAFGLPPQTYRLIHTR